MPTMIKYSSLLVMAMSLVAMGYAANDLSGGAAEMASHWWSSLPVATTVAAAAMWLGATLIEKRRLHHQAQAAS